MLGRAAMMTISPFCSPFIISSSSKNPVSIPRCPRFSIISNTSCSTSSIGTIALPIFFCAISKIFFSALSSTSSACSWGE